MKRTEDALGTWKTAARLYEGDNPHSGSVSTGRKLVCYNIIVNGQILAQYKRLYPSTDSVVYFHLDYLGSRRVVVNSSGTAIDRYSA